MSETNGNGLGDLAAALAKAQAAFPKVLKDRTAKIRSPKGDYEYKYADLGSILEATRKPLTDNGLALSQPIEVDDAGRMVLHTILLHVSGAHLNSYYPLTAHERPQEMGSEITYSRRYTAGSILGIASEEDDDGAAAQHAPKSPSRTVTVPAQPPIDGEAVAPFDYEPPDENAPDPRPGFAAGDKTCPYCKKATVIKGKAEYGGGWLCFQKRGGCGQKWPEGAPAAGSSKAIDKDTGEVLEGSMDNRAFLLAGIVKDMNAYQMTSVERQALADKFLASKRAHECRDEAALNRLYMFLGDTAAVAQWRRERAA